MDSQSKVSRRDFLKFVAGFLTTMVLPSFAFAKHKNNQINLEFKVDKISKDFLSEDFYLNKKKSIIYDSLKKTKEFYSQIGDKYGLPSVDINLVESSLKETSKNGNFRFCYTTRDKFMEKIEKDINLVENIKGKEAYDELYQKGIIHSFLTKNMLIQTYNQQIDFAGGASIPGTKEIFLFPKKEHYNQMKVDKPEVRRNAISLLSFINCHELAHAFWLNHVGEIPENKYNIMAPMSFDNVLKPKLNKEQVKKIANYFK
jgi:hypothetical protein